MSVSPIMSSNSSSVPLGTRTNIFDSETGEFDLDRDPGDPSKASHTDDDPASVDELLERDRGSHEYVSGVNREAWVAGSILRSYDNPPLFCPECWHQFEVENELSDPEDHLPLIDRHHTPNAQPGERVETIRHDHRRHRHCPECGVLSFGGVLGDRETETFMEIVRWFLGETDVIRDSRREDILAAARQRKQQRGQSDDANMERVVREVRYNLDPDFPN
jgi:hypothetical protein